MLNFIHSTIQDQNSFIVFFFLQILCIEKSSPIFHPRVLFCTFYSDAIFIWDVFIYWPNILDILFLYRSRHVFRTVCYLLRRRARVLLLISFIFKCRLLTLKERKRLIIFSVYFCTNIYQRGCQSVYYRCLDFLILRTRWLVVSESASCPCLQYLSAGVLKTQCHIYQYPCEHVLRHTST